MNLKNLVLPAAIALLITAGGIITYRFSVRSSEKNVESKSDILKASMRKLWAEHTIWMREYLVSSIAKAPDNKAVSERLIKNQFDLGDIMGEYYGADVGNEFTILLKDHIALGMEAIATTQDGNEEKLNATNSRWQKNAEDISHFLQKINPIWKVSDLMAIFGDHLNHTINGAKARIKKEWQKDIKGFDDIFDQAMKLADMLSAGIIKQFPKKF